MKKRILLISYHFPPSQAVGGLRIFNLAKHLPAYGWQTEVLTIRLDKMKRIDFNRLKDIPDIKIHQTACLPTVSDIYLMVKSIYHSFVAMKYISPNDLQNAYVRSNNKDNKRNTLGNFKRLIISVLLSLPDLERGWIFPAVLKALRLIKQERYDCILTSCPPYSVHLIGLILKMVTGIPWIADFRDPWYKGSHKILYVTTSASKKIEEKLENEVLKRADLIVTTTQRLCDIFTTFFDKRPITEKKKCFCQTNAFDAQIMGRIQEEGKYGLFTITYTGSLYFGRTPEPIFSAVSQLIANQEINPEKIRIKLVGHCDRIEYIPTKAVVEKYGLEGIVQVSDPVPYEDAIKMIKKSHLALLLAPEQPLQIPAKVFDYIGAGTPILTITQKGATYDLIQSTGVGSAFDPDDIAGIKAFIKLAMDNDNILCSTISKDIMQRFNSESLAANVAAKLDMSLKNL